MRSFRDEPYPPPVRQLRLVSLLGLFALAATTVAAAPPQIAYLEKAQTQASGSQIRSFGVPTTDSTGKLFYWDVTVDLAIDANGKPNAAATVGAIKRVNVNSVRFVAGNYTDSIGGTCTVSTGTLPSGRQEVAASCQQLFGNRYRWSFSAASGTIAGHPSEPDLVAAGIGDIGGYLNYAWGIDGQTDNFYGCFKTGTVVSARQIGTQIVVTNYGLDNLSDCGATLTLVP